MIMHRTDVPPQVDHADARQPASDLFAGYQIDGAYDEIFEAPGVPRPHYRAVFDFLSRLTLDEFRAHQYSAEQAFLRQGITFNVYGADQGVERPIPVDLVPRILSRSTWRHLEAGLKQRLMALNLFIHDIYHEQRILRQRMIPTDLVLGSSGYRPEFRGISVPRNIYVHVAGIDLIRDTSGTFMVLEDNLRCPSGVSYLLENRRVMKRVFPWLFEQYHVLSVDDYSLCLREALEYCAPNGRSDPNAVVLTPGAYNSAYFEHTFLAQQMGAPVVQGQDLVIDAGKVYTRTTRGLRRVDVIYRRVDDEYLDPVCFHPESILGAPGLVSSYRLGNVTLANGIGVGVADSKAVYHFVPEMIRYYLGEEPILPNVQTYLARDPLSRSYILSHLHELVVKSVDQSGGYGMMIGPHASKRERAEFAARIKAKPDEYVAQPTISLSTHPTFTGDRIAARHVDLRPFVLYGREITAVPGGFTRVALREGSLVVNSSQGGGSKDTWVLDGEE
jgi:uncharacterized circularly permuted ATP-grasp superfamily protein